MAASIAAMCARGRPPTLVNAPPAYTVAPSVARAYTVSPASGRHGETLSSARMCARFARGRPPTALNEPPMYQPPAPSATAARTSPETLGYAPAGAPVAGSSGTPLPLAVPTQPNAPPM